MQHARNRIRELTDRRRTLLRVEYIVWRGEPIPLKLGRVLPVRELGLVLREDQELRVDADRGIHCEKTSPHPEPSDAWVIAYASDDQLGLIRLDGRVRWTRLVSLSARRVGLLVVGAGGA
jgi:hypothetical protein